MAHPGKRIVLWFMDGWTRRVQQSRSKRPALPPLVGQGAPAAGALRPTVGLHLRRRRARDRRGCRPCPAGSDHRNHEPLGASLPSLTEFAAGLLEDVHAVLVLDGAGWHGARALVVPPNVTLVPLPPYSPELNPVEWVWLYLRERFLSLRVFADYRAIVDACCAAWNRLGAEPGRLRPLCDQPWIRNVSS